MRGIDLLASRDIVCMEIQVERHDEESYVCVLAKWIQMGIKVANVRGRSFLPRHGN